MGSNCKQLELDVVLFIVQMGATGPPRYTLILKTKPDSLTNQGLPGLNTANICRFLTTNKFLPVFFISSTHLSDYMHCRYVLIHTKVMPHRHPSTWTVPLFYCICYVCIACLCWQGFYWSIWARDARCDSSVYWYNPVRQTHKCCQIYYSEWILAYWEISPSIFYPTDDTGR